MPTHPAVWSDALAANLDRAEPHLARFRATPTQHFISGRPDAGAGATFDNLNPADNTSLGEVAAGTADDVDRAARAASAAFPAWRDLDGHRRRAILHDIAARIEARAEEIALVESVDS